MLCKRVFQVVGIAVGLVVFPLMSVSAADRECGWGFSVQFGVPHHGYAAPAVPYGYGAYVGYNYVRPLEPMYDYGYGYGYVRPRSYPYSLPPRSSPYYDYGYGYGYVRPRSYPYSLPPRSSPYYDNGRRYHGHRGGQVVRPLDFSGRSR